MKFVRYTKRYDYRPRASIVMARAAGDEVKITEAEYEAANAAGAVELIDGEGSEPREASAEAGGTAAKGKAGNRPRA